MPDAFDAYRTLQVDPEADPEVIQAAYRRLAQKYHPDVAPGAEAAARMTAINRAWELLRDADRRRAYDAARARPGTARPGSVPESSAHPAPTAAPTEPTVPPTDRGRARDEVSSAGSSTSHRPDEVSRDWTSGRSSTGHTYDQSMRRPDGYGAAGPPPGAPSGSVLGFGRYAGWSLGEIGRRDPDYLEWLDRMPIGRPYRGEIDALLRRLGRRRSSGAGAADRHGSFRRS